MEQLLAHLFGDYVLQTDWMANNKKRKLWIAFLHAFTYTLPFLFLTTSIPALLVIFVTHAFIDHYTIARYVVFAKNWVNQPSLKWKDCSVTGTPLDRPIWLSVWLLIIVDNSIHLAINYFSIKYLG